MKTLGLIGGMSWESSNVYYQYINRRIQSTLGGIHSAKLILYSVNFEEIEQLQQKGAWSEMGKQLTQIAQILDQAGADALVICSNTMHKLAPLIESETDIPLLHIADATGNAIQLSGLQKVGLLGTLFTMEQDFYTHRLKNRFNLDVIVPEATDRTIIHDIIYNELAKGSFTQKSKSIYIDVINRLITQGAQGIILGCTEIPLLVRSADVSVPLFDTMTLHAEMAVDYALKD